MSAIWGYRAGAAGKEGIILCGREFMNSLDDSSMEEVKTAIRSVDWLNAYYEIGERFIRSRDRRVRYVFAGLRHNLDSIKSKTRILLAWIDEAEPVSEEAWRKLIPTVREDGSEIWVTWNPEDEESPTHIRFRKQVPDDAKIVRMNYSDNPWFPDTLEAERQRDKKFRPDVYPHIWEGAFLEMSDRTVFRNWEVDERTPPAGVVWFYGADWGFANDPTAAVRLCFLDDETIYVDSCVSEAGVPMEETPALLMGVKDIARWPVRADSARPETIDYVRRHGLPKLRAAQKGKGSIEDGITFLQGFNIVVHPDCAPLIRELRRFSYKVDRQTGEPLPVIEDKDNHLIDAMRYAVEGMHSRGRMTVPVVQRPVRRRDYEEQEPEVNWKTV